MKTIGLIGGMSWESTSHYYATINREINRRLGGFHSAKILLVSVDFADIENLQSAGNWQAAGNLLAHAALQLQAAGAECIVICTNTMHKVASQIELAVKIPLLHIADATGRALVAKQIKQVALLGTAFTMSQDFYKRRLADNFPLSVSVPNAEDQEAIHHIIYQELCQGVITEASRETYITIMNKLHQQGAQAIILGCTEIGLLVSADHTSIPLFDTTLIHSLAAVDFALS
ncbi:aspartate/glutamate racemase family protein [Simiduia curdlanivorans]|uniref:Aspartate/glutamate racemase family protein n=1 Tax=Simiduia curdlanivorans TaxID=1492769 RepID=A0ABV8UYU2_9GAMM|nr:aspartate/glutamate racemase family protein [Simiduia curdlanivorans]MDN3640472.1 aspartate/glutamate racemase family protein [Simiduia curdlanivorans]